MFAKSGLMNAKIARIPTNVNAKKTAIVTYVEICCERGVTVIPHANSK